MNVRLESILARQTPADTIQSAYRAMLALRNHRTADGTVASMRSERSDPTIIAARRVIDEIEAAERRPIAEVSDERSAAYVRQLSAYVFDRLREVTIEKGVDLEATAAAAEATLKKGRTLEPLG